MADQKIFSAMADAMAEVDAIGKDKRNGAQGFNFRGIDDVYNKLHAVMARHRIFTAPEVIAERTEERKTKNGSNLIYRVLTITYHFYTDDGSSVAVTVIGEGMDSGDKASNKAMSIAHKYALFQVFMIPTEEIIDPDAHTPEPSAPAGPEPKQVAAEIKQAIETMQADETIREGFRQDARTAWASEDIGQLIALRDKILAYEPEIY